MKASFSNRSFVLLAATAYLCLGTGSVYGAWEGRKKNNQSGLGQKVRIQMPGQIVNRTTTLGCEITASPNEVSPETQTSDCNGVTVHKLENDMIQLSVTVKGVALGTPFRLDSISGNPRNVGIAQPVAPPPAGTGPRKYQQIYPWNPAATSTCTNEWGDVEVACNPASPPGDTNGCYLDPKPVMTMGVAGSPQTAWMRYPFGPSTVTYTAQVSVGLGPPATCTAVVKATCNGRQTQEGDHSMWHPYTTFDAWGMFWIPNNDAPQCTFTSCETDAIAGWTAGSVDPSDFTKCHSREYNGCFDGNTRIRLADGTEKMAVSVRSGDALWNPVSRKGVTVSRIVVGPEAEPLIEFVVGKERLRVTTKHPMITKRGFRSADQVRLSDSLQLRDLTFARIKKINRITSEEKVYVYNYEMDEPSLDPNAHLIVADGIVTGDYYLQQQLKKGKGQLP